MKQQLNVEGMHCASCAMTIDGELEELDGVKQSKTSYAKQKTEVEYDESKLSTGALVATIAELGYRATPAG